MILVRGLHQSAPPLPALSFEEFFEAERPRLFRALLLVTRNTHEAEELMQDAFMKVWERWDRVQFLENPTAYLYTTAMNAFRTRYRRALLAAKRTLAPTPSADPFDVVAAHEEALQRLGRLTQRQRAALVLTDLLGHSFEQAAKELGIKPGTVRVLVSQARAALKRGEGSDE
jgi:RNA polymerase sigma-70 factor (ECF subfamily)